MDNLTLYSEEEIKNLDVELCEEQPTNYDTVEKPMHYNKPGAMEAWDVIQRTVVGYNPENGYYMGNAIKYMLRWFDKNGSEDLRKCRAYLKRVLDVNDSGDDNKMLRARITVELIASDIEPLLNGQVYYIGNIGSKLHSCCLRMLYTICTINDVKACIDIVDALIAWFKGVEEREGK